ncbi:MAG: aspartate kinase, partial [Rhodothermales bacterium]|nr:aspartate kinase [Rhodothermales bacterium]
MKVLKFGGSSIGTSNGIHNASDIVVDTNHESRVVVVVSALSGVTDRLIDLEVAWSRGDDKRIDKLVHWLHARHINLGSSVLGTIAFNDYHRFCDRQLDWLRTVLQVRANGPSTRDEILALGERLSAPLFASLLQRKGVKSAATDSTLLIRTNANHGDARIVDHATTALLRTWYRSIPSDFTPVVTGFLGSTSNGMTTTLGRSGSDYSASAIGVILQAHVVERWTDTDGLYSSNPAEEKEAEQLPRISLSDAIRRHRETGLGIHPKALEALEDAGIPLHV